MDRKSGVLMHISTLWGEYSCGSFGKSAMEFVDFLADCGFTYWQVLPFCPADDYNSPYKSYSTFAGNPYFIDLEQLFDEGLILSEELDAAKQNTPYLCEFERLETERLALLFKAAQRVENKNEIEKFIAENSYISDFCEFMALKTANDQKPWWEWNCDKTDDAVLFGWKFVEFKFFEQWSIVKEYANKKGIKIIGDIPFYVALDSSDVWKNADRFMIDEKNVPYAVAGVPPDYFCEDGQLWGNPLYNWEAMKENDYKWWCDRMSAMLKMFDGVNEDLSGVQIGKITGQELIDLIVENVLNNLISRTRNSLIQWSDIQVNRSLFKKIKNNQSDLAYYDAIKIRNKETGEFEPIKPDKEYSILLPDKYLVKDSPHIETPAKIREKFEKIPETYDSLFRKHLEMADYEIKITDKQKEERIL